MAATIPTESEVLGYFDSLSNWGRWGDDDQLGTLNFLSPEKTRRAVALVQDGVTVFCARTVTFESAPDIPTPPLHFMVESGEGWATGDKARLRHRRRLQLQPALQSPRLRPRLQPRSRT